MHKINSLTILEQINDLKNPKIEKDKENLKINNGFIPQDIVKKVRPKSSLL